MTTLVELQALRHRQCELDLRDALVGVAQAGRTLDDAAEEILPHVEATGQSVAQVEALFGTLCEYLRLSDQCSGRAMTKAENAIRTASIAHREWNGEGGRYQTETAAIQRQADDAAAGYTTACSRLQRLHETRSRLAGMKQKHLMLLETLDAPEQRDRFGYDATGRCDESPVARHLKRKAKKDKATQEQTDES